MDSADLTLYATAIAYYICKNTPDNKLLLLGSLLSQVAETINRVNVQREILLEDSTVFPWNNDTAPDTGASRAIAEAEAIAAEDPGLL